MFWFTVTCGMVCGGLTNLAIHYAGYGGIESWILSFMIGMGFVVEKMRWDG